MANKSIHCKIGIVDQYGNIVTISPQTTGDDVYIKENQFKKGTTLQTLVDNLGNIAFTNDFLGINDNDTNNEYKTWSTSKILSEYHDIELINTITINEFKEKCNIILNKIQELDGSASPTDSIQTLCNKIQSIYNKGFDRHKQGNATAEDGLQGVSWYNASGKVNSGSIIKHNDIDATVYTTGSYVSVPNGYYDTIKVNCVGPKILRTPLSSLGTIMSYTPSSYSDSYSGTLYNYIPIPDADKGKTITVADSIAALLNNIEITAEVYYSQVASPWTVEINTFKPSVVTYNDTMERFEFSIKLAVDLYTDYEYRTYPIPRIALEYTRGDVIIYYNAQ